MDPGERIRLLAYPPLGTGGTLRDAIALDPRETACNFTTTLPGGFETAQIGLYDPNAEGWAARATLPRPLEIPDFAHIELRVGGGIVFEGRAEKFTYQGAGLVGFEAYGYGTNYLKEDGWYASRESNVAPVLGDPSAWVWLQNERTTRSLVADVLAGAAPLVRLADDLHAQDPGLWETPFRYYGQTPQQVLDAVTKKGDALGLTWDYAVWEGRRLYLLPRALAPTAIPDYQVPLDQRVSWVRDLTQTAGGVVVEFTLPAWDLVDIGNEASLLTGVPNPGATARSTAGANPPLETPEQVDETFEARFGVQRRLRLKGGALTPQEALAFAKTEQKSRTVAADTVTIKTDGGVGLPVPGGGTAAAERVRAGQWVSVGGQNLPVVRTRYDSHAMTLETTLGVNAQSFVSMIAALRDTARHLVLDTNPLTGAPRS